MIVCIKLSLSMKTVILKHTSTEHFVFQATCTFPGIISMSFPTDSTTEVLLIIPALLV